MISSALLFNTFSWFFIGQMMISKIGAPADITILSLGYSVAVILSAAVGAQFLTKIRRQQNLFLFWLIFGSLVSLLPMVTANSPTLAVATAILMGISLGIGLPSCLAYFTYSTPIEKRGKAGGILLMFTFMCTPLVASSMSGLNFWMSSIVFSLWRGWSLPFAFKASFKGFKERPRRGESNFFTVIKNRQLYLYFIAWLMFSFVDGFGSLSLRDQLGDISLVQPIIAGLSALGAGIISDWTGRKRVLIFGFISLGLAYAIIGIFTPSPILTASFVIVEGIAIGLLWVVFTIVLWGEVATSDIEKSYAIGEAPLFLTLIISTLTKSYIDNLSGTTSVFSLAAFFLFIAVIPLLYTRETLPQRKIEERQLKIYTEE
ncbi:hypothetical protein KAS06_04280, partial [Candidatus Bathyarchaeota archaeon]|nr:hypothetical protein [Candidatus Bathyarchaeota archaeon]